MRQPHSSIGRNDSHDHGGAELGGSPDKVAAASDLLARTVDLLTVAAEECRSGDERATQATARRQRWYLMTGEGAAQAEILGDANKRIRDSAKWLIGAMAAIAAVLVAGSQLSSIGKLPITWSPQTISQWRFWVALGGLLIALIAVSLIILAAAIILIPRVVTLEDLREAWRAKGVARLRSVQSAVHFLQVNSDHMHGYETPQSLMGAYKKALTRLERARADAVTASWMKRRRAQSALQGAEKEFEQIDDIIDGVLSIATHERFVGQFRRMVASALVFGLVAAIGIILFAWAANPS